MRFLHRGEIGLAGRCEEAVRDLGAIARRKIDRQTFLAEGLLNAIEQSFAVHVLRIDLVDDDHAVEPALLRVLHEARRHHLDAVLRVDDDRRGLDCRQRGKRVAEEVRVARGVEEVDADRLVIELRLEACDRQLLGMSKLLFPWGVVANSGASLHAAGGVHRSRFREQRLGQGGLAAARLSDERDRPDALNGIRHRPALPSISPLITGISRSGKEGGPLRGFLAGWLRFSQCQQGLEFR